MALGGTLRAPAMGVGSEIRSRVDQSFHGHPAALRSTPFVPPGRVTPEESGCYGDRFSKLHKVTQREEPCLQLFPQREEPEAASSVFVDAHPPIGRYSSVLRALALALTSFSLTAGPTSRVNSLGPLGVTSIDSWVVFGIRCSAATT